MKAFIVADVGGTQIRAGIFTAGNPVPLTVKKIKTVEGHQMPTDRLIGLLHEIWPDDMEVAGIIVAVPGFLDPYEGFVFEAVNVPGWNKLNLREIIQDEFHIPVLLGNDANLAALGEWRYGAGRGYHDILYLTISTGIGGGAIINDQLLVGARGFAGEFGHVTVRPEGPKCTCGQRGHLEAMAAGPAIARFVKEKIAIGFDCSLAGKTNISAKDVSEAAKAGDPLCIRAIQQAGTYIGFALSDFLHILNPAIIILGGGVGLSGNLIVDAIIAAMPERIMGRGYLDKLIITTAQLGDEAGLIGGLALAEGQLQ
jgi:glucokinase